MRPTATAFGMWMSDCYELKVVGDVCVAGGQVAAPACSEVVG